MSKAGSTVGPAPLVACSGGTSDVIEPRRGVAIIGHSCRVGTQIDDSRISQTHLRAVSDDGRWRIVGNIPRGMFVGGRRGSSVTVSDKTLIRFGDPPGGKALTFEVVRPSDSAAQHGRVQPSADLSDDPAHNAAPVAPDPGVVRAGAAAAARRRELDISQRSLAADGIINAGALIAFEKGRSWPRERTREKLEEVLQWPAGTIARIRRGEPTEPATNPDASPGLRPADGPASLIAQAVTAAVDGCSLAIAALPATEDPEFTERAAPILADLRQLEAIAVQATRISRITPELIKALGAVRRHHDELMRLGATAPGATLAQRLYAARRRANLSTLETAQAAGVAEEMIVGAEAEEELPAEATEAIEALIRQIN
ncbi:FHA domain-containing protein [Mycobacterium tuberculosis]|uniref:ESX-1 type VII secretion system transcriptional regulator EspM n=1 Tax=Mycobacterium tuberculosis TaxID=1773 RepID=UPI0032B5AF6A